MGRAKDPAIFFTHLPCAQIPEKSSLYKNQHVGDAPRRVTWSILHESLNEGSQWGCPSTDNFCAPNSEAKVAAPLFGHLCWECNFALVCCLSTLHTENSARDTFHKESPLSVVGRQILRMITSMTHTCSPEKISGPYFFSGFLLIRFLLSFSRKRTMHQHAMLQPPRLSAPPEDLSSRRLDSAGTSAPNADIEIINLLVPFTNLVERQRNILLPANVEVIVQFAHNLLRHWKPNKLSDTVNTLCERTIFLAQKVIECAHFQKVPLDFGQDYSRVRHSLQNGEELQTVSKFVKHYNLLKTRLDSLKHNPSKEDGTLALAMTVTMATSKVDDAEAALSNVEPYFKEAVDIMKSTTMKSATVPTLGTLPNPKYYSNHLRRMWKTPENCSANL